MSGYSVFRSYSPLRDADMARVSMWDGNGSEYWMWIPCEDGKAYRAARNTAVEAIFTAIQMGLDPGLVRIN